jgi:integrase
VCLGCYNFARASFGHEVGECGACRRRQPLKENYCRLCWCQARADRALLAQDARSAVVLAPYVRAVRHQQLFLANLDRRRAKPRRIERRRGAKGRPFKAPPPVAARPQAAWVQSPLFDLPRSYTRKPVDLRSVPAPDNPYLTWALYLAHSVAEARGWSPMVRGNMQRMLVTVLAGYRHGEVIRASELPNKTFNINLELTVEILTAMGIAQDDRPNSFDLWLRARLADLALAIAHETDRWARLLLEGGARTRPRGRETVRSYVVGVLPALIAWSARYHHLREVTAGDVREYIAPLRGYVLQRAVVALRSLFGWARKNRVVFRNPAANIRLRKAPYTLWQPLAPEQIAQAVKAATTPQARLYLALSAVHAARPGQIRALQLDDIDIVNRRITIAAQERPLDELTHSLLQQWLEHRRTRWPNTANPHLLVNRDTCLHHGPVSPTWVLNLRHLPATYERLRIDRQLEEALITGGDPLHLAVVFGISDTTAVRYATNAKALLAAPDHSGSSTSPRTGARHHDGTDKAPSGSN